MSPTDGVKDVNSMFNDPVVDWTLLLALAAVEMSYTTVGTGLAGIFVTCSLIISWKSYFCPCKSPGLYDQSVKFILIGFSVEGFFSKGIFHTNGVPALGAV